MTVDAEVQRLLSDVVDSFEKLEVVVHVFRTRTTPQTTDQIAKAVAVSAADIADALAELARDGVVRASSPEWCFETGGPWASAVGKLVETYDHDRLELVNSMAQAAVERIRTSAARVFADAFLLKSKKKGDPDA